MNYRLPGVRANTKIIATVGPACREEGQLAALIAAGVDVFRLNMAHGEIPQHEEVLQRIRKLSAELKHPIAVLVDLAGPKIRLGEIPGGSYECELDQEFYFIREEESSDPRRLASTYDRLVDELEVGDQVMLADGTVSMLVEAKTRGSKVPLRASRADPQPPGNQFARREGQPAGHERGRQGTRRLGGKKRRRLRELEFRAFAQGGSRVEMAAGFSPVAGLGDRKNRKARSVGPTGGDRRCDGRHHGRTRRLGRRDRCGENARRPKAHHRNVPPLPEAGDRGDPNVGQHATFATSDAPRKSPISPTPFSTVATPACSPAKRRWETIRPRRSR